MSSAGLVLPAHCYAAASAGTVMPHRGTALYLYGPFALKNIIGST